MILDRLKISFIGFIIKLSIIIIVPILLIVFIFDNNIYADSNKNVYLNSNKYSLKRGEEFIVTLNADNVAFGAFTTYINFDKDKIEFVSGPENINVKENEIIYVWFDKSGGSSSKKDVLGEFKFKAKKEGTITITCFGDFYDNNGEKLDINFKEVRFFINDDKKENENKSTDERNIIVSEDLEESSFDSKSSTFLETLEVEDVILYPNFDNSNYEYNGQVSVDTSDINILAIPENEKASVNIKKSKLKEGNNKIIVVVTSEDKRYSKEYILNIYKRNSIEEKEYLEYKEKNNERLEKAYDIAYTINENDEDNIAFLENAQVEDFNFFQIIGVLTLLLVLIAIIFFNKKYRNGKK